MWIVSTTQASCLRKYSCFQTRQGSEHQKKMWLKHNLWPEASKMNIAPNLHSMLISIPKMTDADYIALLNKKEARIYNAMTSMVSVSKDPILIAPRCQDTTLWKLDLDYKVLGRKYPDLFIAGVYKANTIFNLPNTRQSLLYHHALVGFPPKETFLAAVRVGNYAMWPGLTTTLIHKHFPDFDKTQKGHIKEQRKGVRLTKVSAPVTIKVEPGTANPPPPTITKHYDILSWYTNCWTPSTQIKLAHSQLHHNKAIGTPW
jgi:hypothetical protein